MRAFKFHSAGVVALFLAAGSVSAAPRDPLVIPGVGPELGDRLPRQVVRLERGGDPSARLPAAAGRSAYYNTPFNATPLDGAASFGPPARDFERHNGRSRLGGGLIEAIATGFDPPAPPVVFNTPRQPSVPQPALRHASLGAPSAALGSEIAPRLAIDPAFQRAEVAYDGGHAPGTIVVDTPSKFLYLVQPGGRAIRYGIGVGRPGFTWSGVKHVSRKAAWPDWTPPPEMLRRRPDLPPFMAGGPGNPLGARALYLGSSLYRIHGTNEPHTIGRNVSSGCIRMMNDDVTDLYNRVGVGARVVVI